MMISIMNEKEAKELYLFHYLTGYRNIIGKTEFIYFMLLGYGYQYVMELRYIVQVSCVRLYIYFSVLIKSWKESIFWQSAFEVASGSKIIIILRCVTNLWAAAGAKNLIIRYLMAKKKLIARSRHEPLALNRI